MKALKASNHSTVAISVAFTPAEANLLRALAQAEHGGDVGKYVHDNMKSIVEADCETFAASAKSVFA